MQYHADVIIPIKGRHKRLAFPFHSEPLQSGALDKHMFDRLQRLHAVSTPQISLPCSRQVFWAADSLFGELIRLLGSRCLVGNILMFWASDRLMGTGLVLCVEDRFNDGAFVFRASYLYFGQLMCLLGR